LIRRPRDRHEHLVSKKLLTFCYLQMGIFEAFASMMTYFIIMADFGFPFFELWQLALKGGYAFNVGDKFDPNDPYMGNSYLSSTNACASSSTSSLASVAKYTPDWIYSKDIATDTRLVFVQCDPNGGNFLINSLDFGACRWHQISSQTGLPICFTTDSIKYAQTGFFCAVVVVQWACLVVNKTSRTSIFVLGFKNYYQLWGLMAETIFCILLAYIPGINDILGTRDIDFLMFGMAATPWALFMLIYDEIRKYLIRKRPKGGYREKPGWWYRNYCF